MKITSYQSSQAEPHKRWLTHMDLGGCHMNFFASTEAEAVAKAQQFFAAEKARQMVIHGTATVVAVEPEKRISNNPGGRGLRFLGKVWMLNRRTGERARIEAGEVLTYEQRGFVRGGPRSK